MVVVFSPRSKCLFCNQSIDTEKYDQCQKFSEVFKTEKFAQSALKVCEDQRDERCHIMDLTYILPIAFTTEYAASILERENSLEL